MAAISNTFTDTISITYTGNGKQVTSQIGTYTGTSDAGVATVIPAGSTQLEIDIAFPYTTIQALIMQSDQDLTVDVNSTSTPAPTITLKKTAGLVWASDYQNANPFTQNVTKFYVTNAGSTDAKFNFRVLYNKLP